MRCSNHLGQFLAASTLLVLTSAQAGIVSVSGAALQIAAPASAVANTSLESFTAAFVFNERQNVTLSQAVQVNITTTGVFSTVAHLTPGAISVGSLISSYYLHADPVGSSGTTYRFTGSVTFDSDILGIAGANAELVGSNFLGAPGTTYPNAGTVNGVDFADGTDSVTISSNRRTLDFSLLAWAGSDALRVITAGTAGSVVPEPGALGLVVAALGALTLTRRKRVAQA